MTKAAGIRVIDSVKASLNITGQAGVAIDPLNAAANNTSVLIGQTAIPTGNFGIYSATTNNSYFSGSLGIGTATPATKLVVTGNVRIGTSGTNGCIQNFAGTALVGTCSSDQRLKTVLGPVGDILDRFAKLDLVRFKWNEIAGRIYHSSTTATNIGFLAQQVEKQFPELVSVDAHGYRQVNYSDLQVYGAEAIKELKSKSDRQAKQIDVLLREITKLRAEVANLRSRNAVQTAKSEYQE